jgi:hypothetical protein
MRETPPTPPHRNPVNNMSITDQSSKDYRKCFLAKNTAHCPAKKIKTSGLTLSYFTGLTLSYSARTLFLSFTCVYKQKLLSQPPRLELYLCFLKIENSYKDLHMSIVS